MKIDELKFVDDTMISKRGISKDQKNMFRLIKMAKGIKTHVLINNLINEFQEENAEEIEAMAKKHKFDLNRRPR